jgi:hypothetical protein
LVVVGDWDAIVSKVWVASRRQQGGRFRSAEGRSHDRNRSKQDGRQIDLKRDWSSFFFPSSQTPPPTLIPQTQFHPLFQDHDSLTLIRCFHTNCRLHVTTIKTTYPQKITLAIPSNQCIKPATTSKARNTQLPTTNEYSSRAVSKISIIVQYNQFAPRLFGPKASNPPTSPRVK